MGALFSFFRRKKPEPTDYAQILGKISTEIEDHKKRKAEFIAGHRKAISRLLIGFCVIELLLVLWYYFHQKPTEILDHLLHISPLFLVPILVWQLKNLISFYYNKRIERCDELIQELIEQQQEKVAELKRITNFDVVSTLLNRYDPETKRRQAQPPQPKPAPQPKPKPTPVRPPQHPTPAHPVPTPQRPVPATPAVQKEPHRPPATPLGPTVPQTPQQTPTYVMPVPKLHNPTPLPPTPAIGQRKGWMDKMVDFLVGDGPEYSVAVTCKACGAYYANLPKEEVPYTRFTCHNCGRYNEEKQQKGEKMGGGEVKDKEKEKEKEKEKQEGTEEGHQSGDDQDKEKETVQDTSNNEAITEGNEEVASDEPREDAVEREAEEEEKGIVENGPEKEYTEEHTED